MDLPGPARPRISRETRRLLVTILISVAVLWALARIRFPDRPATANPVPPLLTQLVAPPGFGDLASEVAKVESQLLPSLVVVELPGSAVAAALRVRAGVGALLVATAGGPVGAGRAGAPALRAHDPASGLALMSVPDAPAPELTSWSPQSDRPRYLIASDVLGQRASLRPVFIGRLQPGTSPAWPGEIWILPARTNVAPGDFLFTIDGALAGLVIAHDATPAVVPGEAVLRAVDHLLDRTPVDAGWLGVEVQALTPSLASATGARAGVMIVSIDPDGPAAGRLAVMDVIEAAGQEAIVSIDAWRVRVARLARGTSIVLRLRRRGETMDVALTAAAAPAPSRPLALGLTMRTLRRIGTEVVQVADGSAGARAGIREGDVITAIGEIQTPTAPQVTRAFAAAPDDRALLVAITRGNAHQVLALEKK